MKGTMTMKKMMMVAAATIAAWCSWGAESIAVKEVANHYPWDGKVDCVFTLSGMENWRSYEGAFELSVKKDGVTSCRAITNALANVNGTYTNTFDCTALFGAGYYPNGGIAVKLVKKIDGVQLWAGGPYFATCNVGATKPEERGYYFWWGDTIGYTYDSSKGWCALDGSATRFWFSSAETYNKTVSELTNAGYIDSNGNLVAKYDAATAHWGAPWRMPTDAEMQKLCNTSYCTWTWNTSWKGTCIAGYEVTGATTGYKDKSIFLPAAGMGSNGVFDQYCSVGRYWSSTVKDGNAYSYYLICASDIFGLYGNLRYMGLTVRPVRSAE